MKISREEIYPTKIPNRVMGNGTNRDQDQVSDFSDDYQALNNGLEDVDDSIS